MDLKEWKEFKEYRNKEWCKVINSEDYKETEKKIREFRIKLHSAVSDSFYISDLYNIQRIRMLKVPSETIEEFHNWKLRNKK